MRWLVWLVVVAGALWSGWWFIGSSGTERLMSTWLEDRRAEGWAVNYSQLNTAGFPNRFDTTIEDVEIADPATGVAFSAPFLQLLSLSYAPNHVIAVFPPSLTLASPIEKLKLENSDMRASLIVEPNTKLTLDRTTIQMEGLTITSSKDWTASVESAQFATRQAGDAQIHDIALTTLGLAPSLDVRKALDPAGLLPGVVTEMKLDATVDFDAPWDLDALEKRRPQPTNVILRDMSAVWGGLELRVAGTFTITNTGQPEGTLTVKAVNWRELLALLQSNGTVPKDIGPLANAALEALANASGRPDTLDAPLSLRGGYVRLGPIPLGPTPRIWIR